MFKAQGWGFNTWRKAEIGSIEKGAVLGRGFETTDLFQGLRIAAGKA
jgi:hypothetical protein